MKLVKKVDTYLKRILEAQKLKFVPIIVVFNKAPDDIIQSRMRRLGMNIKYVLPFMNALCGIFPIRNIESLIGILEVKSIYHDGICTLMASNDSTGKDVTSINYNKSYLNGKGITIAFIDSGVYPHPDLIKPRNRIAAFRDFVNGIDWPYDDNGHGTACAGIAAGASIDGKFMSAAYEANIVCAKAFNRYGTGFFSNVLASMQWIIDEKEKHNIKITVLPFGTASFDRNFNILELACQHMWEQSIFIVSCSGNYGPHECSITSPGTSIHSFTAAGCEIKGAYASPLDISGRGPTLSNSDKPDCIMPASNIAALNSDITFIPKNSKSYVPQSLPILYTSISGTSAAASFAASTAALLYQKLEGLPPDAAKSILRKCSVSMNFLKPVQGAGIIDVKKLEEVPVPERK